MIETHLKETYRSAGLRAEGSFFRSWDNKDSQFIVFSNG